jgi:putative CocE/NonD family hydrolase
MKFSFSLIFFLSAIFSFAQENPARNDKKETKVSRLGEYKGYSEPTHKGFDYQSFYHTTKDGVKLAVDLFLPKKRKAGEKFPTILYLTRYVRTLEGKALIKLLRNPILGQIGDKEIKFFTSHGYACMIIDARGSGASSSFRDMDFSHEEIRDAAELMDWIVAQSWSNGNIGTTGVSYVGTTAELIIANQHPAHKAAIPRSAIFDLYEDISFPGGLRQGPFVNIWGKTTAALDKSDLAFISKKAKKFIRGVNPVQGDKKREQLMKSLEDHKNNYQVHEDILLIDYRDELHRRLKKPIDDFSVHSRIPAIAGAKTAIYRIGGYYDGALGASLIKGLLNMPNTERVLIGPWDHGPHDYASPFATYESKQFNIFAEMLRFFDYHLKDIDNGIRNEPKINYFTVGKEQWDTASVWPPAQGKSLIYEFGNDSSLWEFPNRNDRPNFTTRTFQINYDFTTGGGARWNSLTPLFRGEPHTNYLNWKTKTVSCLSYMSAPIQSTFTITGEPVFTINISSDAADGAVVVFLEEVKPDGTVYYITEGELRLMHRKAENVPMYKRNGPSHSYKQTDAVPMPIDKMEEIQITALPISYQVAKDSRLRISIAGADKGHFDEVKDKPRSFSILSQNSRVVLPVSNR